MAVDKSWCRWKVEEERKVTEVRPKKVKVKVRKVKVEVKVKVNGKGR